MPHFLSQAGSLQDAMLVPGLKSLPSGETWEWHSGCQTVPDSILLNQRIQVKLDPSQIGQNLFWLRISYPEPNQDQPGL